MAEFIFYPTDFLAVDQTQKAIRDHGIFPPAAAKDVPAGSVLGLPGLVELSVRLVEFVTPHQFPFIAAAGENGFESRRYQRGLCVP